ncbi:putative ribonuclease H-like domain-containing protein [Tanacetum coccineum]
MSIDDLYNNFKIVEQSVNKFVGASSGAQNLAFMTTPSTSSTNDVNTAIPAYEVSTASPNVNVASPHVSTASFSDNVVYAFMVENPNGSNLLQQDLEQIHEDDLEAMDLKWQLSLLSMRAKRYYQRTGKKIFINANDTDGYDKSKIECFNCHKMGHFARECRASRNKEGQFRNQDYTRKQGNNEDTSSNTMLAIDGVGFDWSDMAEEQVQTNMALMAFSDSRKNEVLFSEEVAVLKGEVACKDYEINVLKSEFEKVKQEKEGIEFKIKKFDKASKDLDKLLGSQITDKSKKGLGYSKENSDDSLIKEQVSKDTSSFVKSSLNVDKETVFPVDKKGKATTNDAKDKLADDSRPKKLCLLDYMLILPIPDVNTGSLKLNDVGPSVNTASSNEHDSPEDMFTMGVSSTLEDNHIESFSDKYEPEVDLGNITSSYIVPTTPNTRIHKDHPIDNVIGDVKSSVQTRRMTKPTSKQGFLNLPSGKRAIGTKWVFRNKKDERVIMIRNKARLVALGHRQEEGIDYEEVFALVARIEEIRLFLTYASFMGFMVYQMDVKSAFLYGTIEEEVYVTQPQGFKDPNHPDKVYKVVKALYGLHQAPRACQDKYVAEILKKFNYIDVKSASTPVDLEKPLVKDGDADDVDVHLYRSMIGSLKYLTASKPDNMFCSMCMCQISSYSKDITSCMSL